MRERKVVVTGIGIVCAIGHSVTDITEALRAQRHGFVHLPEFAEFKRSRISIGTRIPDFDTASRSPEDWSCPYPTPLRKESLRALNPHCFYAYHATREALANAGLPLDEPLDTRTGLFTASAGSIRNMRYNLNDMYDYGVGRTTPLGIINSVVGTLSYNLASIFGIEGAGCGFASACASSAHALGFARDQIALDRQDRIIVVGAEDGDVDSILPFAAMHALSGATDPNAASLPFDQRRQGFVGSGGAATLILESEEAARKRNAPILAEFVGWGQNADGYKPAAPHPEGRGLRRAMEQALAEAALSPDDIGYINAHATGTPVGDTAEITAIREVFAAHPQVPVSSTKSLTGHTLSMAGALEAGLSILALRDGFLPGTANLEQPDPACASAFLPKDNLPQSADYCMSNSSGFGGANVSLVFKL